MLGPMMIVRMYRPVDFQNWTRRQLYERFEDVNESGRVPREAENDVGGGTRCEENYSTILSPDGRCEVLSLYMQLNHRALLLPSKPPITGHQLF